MNASSPTPTTTVAVENNDALFSSLYGELRRVARQERRSNDSLNTTAVVHELYLRLSTGAIPEFTDPRQFFLYAARAIRNLLVDRARHRLREKSGGGAPHVELDAIMNTIAVDAREALELDDALRQLAREDERAAQVLELHYFGGLDTARIAELLGVVRRTIDRDLAYARAFLKSLGS